MNTAIQQLTPRLNEVFAHLHQNPEISWEEQKTTTYIKQLFENRDCRITTFDDTTGLIIDIGQGEPVVALRADMDALWQEVDGVFQANHSCGHDAHMTIAIGSLFYLLENAYPKQGTFRFIFQPAEEKGNGALSLVEKGVVDDVDFLYGMHLRPIQELRHGYFAPAIRHGAARFAEGTIHGEDAHGARPHLNVNAIQVGSELFQHLNNIQIDPMIPHSVKMTTFHAGGKSPNIIPGNATFSLDIRAQTNEVMDLLIDKVNRITMMLANLHDVTINLKIGDSVAAAVTNDEAQAIMQQAIVDCVGKDNLAPAITTTGGDDFHFYTIKRPALKATMLAIGCDLEPGLHHPDMTFKHECIPQAVEIVTNALVKTVEK
ncbi:amidohydrolase [Virgibacillus dakarensis]|uniref:Amidohydrolase AmhX n=1 Tax=Lentibacillus populi TaxID=1827502 RepID=A0A9W5U271_9BACI|nr:M20 peptidase aminoacylase family protein [Lentibacillus populi]MBT2216424.1 M20 peptidase aminoacylase family protein [Virgibacillus dakarensis]MTW85880.1 amidohydrolase [Virgibacillus dakarensis]GGB61623.1 amidohydrolase AmhX [Lentibacillus populi]